MRYLFFCNTPAHVHLYKHAVRRLRDAGHVAHVLGRDYGCTVPLLDRAGVPHEIYGRCETTKFSLVRELPTHYAELVERARRFDPDLIFGVGAYAAHAGAATGTPVVVVADSEPTGFDHVASKPFVDAFLTPHTFGKDLGEKHYQFRGFGELAYLHPDVYDPNPEIRAELGVGDDDFVILRLNAFGSHHDVGHEGFGPERRRELVAALSDHATVLVSDEGGEMEFSDIEARPFDLHPAKLHDALAEASLLVADTQTMVTEAALLGTPAIRSNSFVGDDDMGNFLALADADLVSNLAAFDAVLDRATDLLTDGDADARWDRRREAFVADKVNLTDVIVDVATEASWFERVSGVESRAAADATPK